MLFGCFYGFGPRPGSGADTPFMAVKMLFEAAKKSDSLVHLWLGFNFNVRGWGSEGWNLTSSECDLQSDTQYHFA